MPSFIFFYYYDDKFSDRLKSAMNDRGIGPQTLSAMLGVSPVTVNRWLDGKFDPRLKNLRNISNVLDVSNDYLLGKA